VGPTNRREKMWFFWLVIAENVVLECACNISDSSLEDNLTEELLCSCCSFPPSSPPSPRDDPCEIIPVLHQFGSVVGIATGYGLGGPGVESRWVRDFPNLSRPALGPTQPPVHWIRVFPGGKERPGRDAGPSPSSSAVVMKE
jgi:hypothetical protein